MIKAKTSDYLQMHQGEIDINELEEFSNKFIDFEKDFQDEIPYKNGVAVIGLMFKFVNALDDGIIVAVIVLATILIMFILLYVFVSH